MLLSGLGLAAHADAPPARPLTFIPQWLPQAQFAGYYVAEARGLYRARGLDVRILTGGPDHPASTALESGDADCASLWLSTAIQMRARGVPLLNVAQILQHSSLLLVAKKSSGIRLPADMNGRKVGVWEGDFLLLPQLFFAEHGLDVRQVPVTASINLFLRGGVDVTVAMWYNEYHSILNAGLDPDELQTFFFNAYGLDFPEDGIYCRADRVRDDPAGVADFVHASLQGWGAAFAHPDEAIDVVLQRMAAAQVPSSRVHQEWMLARVADLVLPNNVRVPSGVLDPHAYARVAEALRVRGSIQDVPDYTAFAPRAASR